MPTRFEQILYRASSIYLTDEQLAHALKSTPESRYAQVKRALKKGDLTRVKRGLYYLHERFATKKPHPFELAQFSYGPSYISLESALSFHGLIPEAVPTTTSVTLKRKKQFSTPLGIFSYHTLPKEHFFLGVESFEENGYRFLIASPWKAILDYIFCYKKHWNSLAPLEDSLRIELDELPIISEQELETLNNFYKKRAIQKFITSIPKEFRHEP